MDRDALDDHLVNRAKALLEENADRRDRTTPDRDRPDPVDAPRGGPDDVDRSDGFSSDELDMLHRNRDGMDNTEMRAFLEKDSEFHDDMKAAEDTSFTGWEERIMIQSHGDEQVESIADELDRDPAAVKVHMRKLGLLE